MAESKEPWGQVGEKKNMEQLQCLDPFITDATSCLGCMKYLHLNLSPLVLLSDLWDKAE